MFCPKCGSLLMPKVVKGKKVLACSCGYRSEGEMSLSDKKKKAEKDLEVIDEEAEQNVMPLVEVKCNKCGNNQAYFWEVQTRAGDEPPTKFFRCSKCKHTWRDYS